MAPGEHSAGGAAGASAFELPTAADIHDAHDRIRDGIVMTPVLPALALADRLPCALHLKLESMQRTGSFKDRGALNRLLALTDEERRRGIVTASAGNHAQAVAWHGRRLGISVTVVMPEHTPLVKVSNTRRHGAEVRFHGATLQESMVEARRSEAEEGRVLVHAYDDVRVIAGQGTIGLELLEQVPEMTCIVVPIGGGGLIGGIAEAVKSRRPDVRVYGVEASAAASAMASRRAGHPVLIESAETIADGIAVKRVGDLTFPLIERYVDDIVAVDEVTTAEAVHLLLEREKVLVEGAGAVGLAAIIGGKLPLRETDVAVMVVSGGNIDVTLLQRIIDRGLVADGRLTRLAVAVRDRPGHLAALTRLVAAQGANVLDVAHRRAFADISVRDVEIVVHLETRGREHMDAVIEALRQEGFAVRETI
ncbi:MAG TPA: threonine ammonia-lyase [Gemmatimonadaceae bacterium]|nr:threonine ammonia-lyase [Gemmatimonadaceae bacterium]